ncbi:MAG: C69 family dipeptidase [Coriobacteriia bacterium]|nr:C69 family dipeptidase [Coriobacteriia bacterium]
MKKYVIALLVAVLPAIFIATPAFACSGVYIGCDANTQGTSIISRSSDTDILNSHSYLKVYGGPDGEKPTLIRCNNGFEFSPTGTFYRFISTQNCDCYCDNYWAFAINECGVSVSSPVSGHSGYRSLDFNAFVKDGLPEDPIAFIVGSSCKTAKEGIELIAKIIDEKGSASDNIVQISDQNECWYMEIYGGHEYCAVKCPNDCVATFGNEYQITTEYATCEDAVCSPHLFSRAQENNFAVYNADGKMNIFNTYVGEGRHSDFSHMRTWGFHRLLCPNSTGPYSTNMDLPLFYKPEHKVSVSEVEELYRDRYEGTEYCPETTGREDTRVIATEEQTKIHLMQTYKDAPADICAVTWFCPNCSEFGNFTPLCNSESVFDKSYTENSSTYEFNKNSASFTMKELNTICDQNRKQLSKGVRDYWKALDAYAQNIMPKLIKEGNKDKINDFCSFMQKQSYEDTVRLTDDINWFLMSNTITQKDGINLYTLQSLPRERAIFEANIDALLFAKIDGWEIKDFKIEQQPEKAEAIGIDSYREIDSGGTVGYLKLHKDNTTVELVTTNGNQPSVGKLIVNGEEQEFKPVVKNDKIYAPQSLLNILNKNVKDYGFITNNDSDKTAPQNVIMIMCLVGAVVVTTVVLLVIGKGAKK